MKPSPEIEFTIREIQPADHAGWLPLWDGYNAFYGRIGPTALPAEITEATWHRFFDRHEPVHALVAEGPQGLLGIAHYLYHRSTTRLHHVCYLQDLFTTPAARGQGVGRALVEAVYEAAREAGSRRVYWQTQASNATGRALYDRIASHLGFIVYSKEL
jgi:GNAT superfamily N-acetyltransferase